MKRIYIPIFFLFFSINLEAQKESGFNPTFKISISESKVQDKNFYLFSAIRNSPELVLYLEQQNELSSLFTNKKNSITEVLKLDSIDARSVVNAYKFSDEDVKKVSSILRKELKSSKVLELLITKDLRPSGNYENFNSLDNQDFLVAVWELCAKGLNQSLSIYGLGEKGLYPKIDSVS
jgi:dsDNA-binding SOS-regulon protein